MSSLRNTAALALLAACLVPASVSAGESRYLGTLTSTGTAVNNTTTATPFVIPPGARLTVVCDAAARLLTDSTATANSGPTKGVPVGASAVWPTSVGSAKATLNGERTAVVAMISQSGTANCDVWVRDGTE